MLAFLSKEWKRIAYKNTGSAQRTTLWPNCDQEIRQNDVPGYHLEGRCQLVCTLADMETLGTRKSEYGLQLSTVIS